MSVTDDILRSYRAPREVLRRRIAGAGEDRALALLMAACLVMFVAQWPYLARLAFEDRSVPLEARLAGALMGWLFIVPLAAYAVAAVTCVLARLAGSPITGFGARMALFWALLAASPLWLLNGLVAGLVGPGPALTMAASAAGLAFLVIWGAGLREANSIKANTP